MKTTTTLPTGTWALDPSTTITVTATKMGLFSIPATLDLVSGMIEIDDEHQIVGVEVVADAASYASKNAKRNEHVRSDDFLAADTYPTITFRTSSVTATGEGYRADGTVTVKDHTTPVTVTIDDVDVSGASASFSASATVDRNAIGVSKLPSLVIASDLALAVSARATLAPSA